VKRPNQDDLLNTNFLIGSKTVARQQVAGAQVWDRALAGLSNSDINRSVFIND